MGHEDGRLEGGLGAVVVAEDSMGTRVLVVNRQQEPRTLTLRRNDSLLNPTSMTVFDDPGAAPRVVDLSGADVSLPPSSITLIFL